MIYLFYGVYRHFNTISVISWHNDIQRRIRYIDKER